MDRQAFHVFIHKLSNVTFETYNEVPRNSTFGIASHDYMELLSNLTRHFSPDITSGTSYKLTVVETITELGICYGVNSKVAAYNSFKYVAPAFRNSCKLTISHCPHLPSSAACGAGTIGTTFRPDSA